jgi:hypothetical protein
MSRIDNESPIAAHPHFVKLRTQYGWRSGAGNFPAKLPTRTRQSALRIPNSPLR